MEGRESIDLAKMGVTATLIILVISAVVSLFYLIYGRLTDYSRGVSSAVSVSGSSKLYDMDMVSNTENLQLVTSVMNALQEGESEALIYVAVRVIDSTTAASFDTMTEDQINAAINGLTPEYFAYENINLTDASGNAITPTYRGPRMMDELMRYLQHYSSKRCIMKYSANDETLTDHTYDYVTIIIYDYL